MDKSNQKSLNKTIQNLNKVDAPKNITEGFFQSPEQKALNASLIQSIVEATEISHPNYHTKFAFGDHDGSPATEGQRIHAIRSTTGDEADTLIKRGVKDSNQFVRAAAIEHPNSTHEQRHQAMNDVEMGVVKAAINHPKSTGEHFRLGLTHSHPYIVRRAKHLLNIQKEFTPNPKNESVEDKLKFAHIVKRLSKSALAARAAKIMARNEEFDGIAEEADETPKPKRVRKPKAATPTPTPAKVTPKRVVVKPKAATPTPAPAKVTPKRVVVKPKAAATNSTVKSKRVSPFENLFTGKGHKLSNKTLALKKEYDQYRKQGHDEETATDMVYAGVKAEGDKKNAIRNRILNTPREPSTLDKIVSKVGNVASKIGAAAQAIRNPEDLANRGARKLARGTGRVVGKIGRGIQSAAKEYFKTPYKGQENYPGAKPSAATIAFHKKGSDTSPAPTKAKSKRGSIKPKTSAPAVYAYDQNESIKVNEVNSTLGKLQAARKRRKTARLALNNSVIVDQTNLVNEAKPSAAVRREIVDARSRERRATRSSNLGNLLRGNTRVAKAKARGETKGDSIPDRGGSNG